MKASIAVSGTFSVDNGVKQEDILAPILFSISFAVTCIYLRFRTSGKIFNLRRFNAKTKTFEMLIRELLYTDDAVFIANSIEDI